MHPENTDEKQINLSQKKKDSAKLRNLFVCLCLKNMLIIKQIKTCYCSHKFFHEDTAIDVKKGVETAAIWFWNKGASTVSLKLAVFWCSLWFQINSTILTAEIKSQNLWWTLRLHHWHGPCARHQPGMAQSQTWVFVWGFTVLSSLIPHLSESNYIGTRPQHTNTCTSIHKPSK